MKNPLLTIGISLAAIFGIGYLVSGRRLQNLSFKLVSNAKYVKQSGLVQNLAQQKVSIDAQILNPNSKEVKIQSFEGTAFMDGKKLSDVKIDRQITIPAKTTANLKNIVLTIPTTTLLSEVYNILSETSGLADFFDEAKKYLNGKVIKLEGVMKADGFIYNVDESTQIKM